MYYVEIASFLAMTLGEVYRTGQNKKREPNGIPFFKKNYSLIILFSQPLSRVHSLIAL
jgi:hypothetical protein